MPALLVLCHTDEVKQEMETILLQLYDFGTARWSIYKHVYYNNT